MASPSEICRRHKLNAGQLYKWKKALERGLKDQGQLVPKSQVCSLQKKVEELERALGMKFPAEFYAAWKEKISLKPVQQ